MIKIEEKHYAEFRSLFIDVVKSKITSDDLALSFSSGIDSASVFFALLELGIKFECYTFYQDGYESQDLISSRKYCEIFGIKLNEITLPSDVDSIYNDVVDIIPFCGKKLKKTKVETLRPLKYVFEHSKHKFIIHAINGDDYQPYGRKVNVFYRKGGDQLVLEKGYRRCKNDIPDSMEVLSREMALHYGIKFFDAYADQRIEDYFMQFGLQDIIYPHKHLVVGAFQDYFEKCGGARKHSSYQINSKINIYHEKLLTSKYNTRNNKAVIGIYNDIAKKVKLL